MAPYKGCGVCLFSNPLSLKVAQSIESDVFERGEFFRVDITYRWMDVWDALQSIFTSVRLYMRTVANRLPFTGGSMYSSILLIDLRVRFSYFPNLNSRAQKWSSLSPNQMFNSSHSRKIRLQWLKWLCAFRNDLFGPSLSAAVQMNLNHLLVEFSNASVIETSQWSPWKPLVAREKCGFPNLKTWNIRKWRTFPFKIKVLLSHSSQHILKGAAFLLWMQTDSVSRTVGRNGIFYGNDRSNLLAG